MSIHVVVWASVCVSMYITTKIRKVRRGCDRCVRVVRACVRAAGAYVCGCGVCASVRALVSFLVMCLWVSLSVKDFHMMINRNSVIGQQI